MKLSERTHLVLVSVNANIGGYLLIMSGSPFWWLGYFIMASGVAGIMKTVIGARRGYRSEPY